MRTDSQYVWADAVTIAVLCQVPADLSHLLRVNDRRSPQLADVRQQTEIRPGENRVDPISLGVVRSREVWLGGEKIVVEVGV